MPRRPTWRYAAGTKRVNRVTVYERRDRPCLYIEYQDGYGQRIQRPLESHTGIPVPNTTEGRDLAVKIAEAVAVEREQAVYRELADAYGVAPIRTVSELLERLEADRGPSWSEPYARDQARHREFWAAKLGTLTLTRVNAALVQRIAAKEAKRRKWTPRTLGSYLRYLVDAFGYAERKLKWIEARDNLSAVDIPSPRSQGEAYTIDEIRKLLPALEAVDVRAGAIGWIAWQTGRRLSAIRKVKKRDVLATEGMALIRFGAGTDKVGRAGDARVVGRAAELVASLLRRPGAYLLGKEPPSVDVCQDWMTKAETAAEVPHKKQRAWHGLKRSFATASSDLRLAAKQSGTRQSTLATIYDKDWSEGKETLARALEALANGAANVPAVPKSEGRA